MPKRINNKYEEKIKFKNMIQAYKRAAKGKRLNKEVILFEFDLATNIVQILKELYNDSYKFSNYRKFTIYEPKEREILSLPFKDRVVHQWYVEEFIKPVYLNIFIKDTYACIEGRGLHLAVKTLQKYMKKAYKESEEYYVLKCDIKKFFYSINKKILYKIIENKFKNKRFLQFTRKIIFQNSTKDNGIPIGNYTSQYFANIYLNELDHYVKEKLKIKYYVRYMDDFILLLKEKNEAIKIKKQLEEFLLNNLKLELNKKTNYFPNKHGVYFCGYRIYRNKIKLSNINKKKINKNVKKWNLKYKNKKLNFSKTISSLKSWEGHAMYETNMVTIKSVIKKCKWIQD